MPCADACMVAWAHAHTGHERDWPVYTRPQTNVLGACLESEKKRYSGALELILKTIFHGLVVATEYNFSS